MCGLFGVKIYDSYTNTQTDFCTPNTVSIIPPSSYDLRDYIDIGVESQSTLGICYAFASLTSLETYLALNYGEYYDFSELHFATSLYAKDNYYSNLNNALEDGGNFNHFVLYTQKDQSLVLEEELSTTEFLADKSYDRLSKLLNKFNNVNNNFYPIAKVNDTKTFPQYVGNKSSYTSTELDSFRKSVKSHIMQYGSVTAGIHTNSTFTYSTCNYRIINDSLVADQSTINSNTNHLISIVGWDDEYDANGAWSNKGAYLCLNSWGTTFGNKGYFYVSYDDYFIESCIQGVVNATLSNTNYKISTISNHQNKTTMFAHVFQNYPTIYTANIFDTSNYVGQNITHIDTFIQGSATKFYIKFFSTKANALAGINSVTHLTSSYKIDDYSMYSKYKLSSPLNISNNFMVVVREVKDTTRTYSLCGNTSDNLNIEPCYYNGSGLGSFDLIDDLWDPSVDGRTLDCTLPLILHTDKQYVQVSPFDSNIHSITNGKYVKNNGIFLNKNLNLTLTNASLTQSDIQNIKITKLYKNSFVNMTDNFEITLSSSNCIVIKMINDLTSSFTTGNYLITIPLGNTTIYRIIEVQDVVTYSITYHLDGGVANNPTLYTNKHTVLTLNNPTKTGFAFIGWYTDSNFTKVFNPNNLPYTNLNLYAKYDFETPSVVSKSKDISLTYYKNLNITINLTATHPLLNEHNSLTYQWYMRKNTTDDFSLVAGATNNNLNLNSVAQSGYYACEISFVIDDPSMVSSTYIKTLNPCEENTIIVNINPFIYDMSKVEWNYTNAISYDTLSHTVEVLNLPSGVTVSYENNTKSAIGNYVARANLIYDDMDGNAFASPIQDLNWQIRKAKITITIDDIVSTEELSNTALIELFSCQIENEYLPENIKTLQDKINYLNISYNLQSTEQPYIKLINATTDSFGIYDITILKGEYRVAVYTLSQNNITTTNENGFVKNCEFSAQSSILNDSVGDLLKQNNLIAVNSYDINYSYLNNEQASINIPIQRDILLNDLCVYMLKDGKLTKLDTSISSNGITFTTSEQNATYIIAREDYSHTSNSHILVVIGVIAVYIALFVYALISGIKHKNEY